MNDQLFALRLFVRVARAGGFSAAGRHLKVPQPTVSRTVSALEQRLGAALLTRTTRTVMLTEAGAEFLARIEPVLAALDEAEQAVRGTRELRGVVRIALPSSLAIRWVVPRLPGFMDRHPALKVELSVQDQWQDLISEGIDVGLRFGPLPDSTALARRIGSTPRVLVASPGYLSRAGVPALPDDLAMHAVISGPSRTAMTWSMQRNGQHESVRVGGRMTVSANEVSTAAAVAGLGISSMGLAACASEIASGGLIRVLSDWDHGTVELNAILPSGRAAKPSARAFVEFLRADIANMPIHGVDV